MSEDNCCKRSLIGSLWDSAKRVVKDPVPVPNEVSESRLTICRACDKFNDGICQECGCILKLKVKFSEMECPIGKWKKWGE